MEDKESKVVVISCLLMDPVCGHYLFVLYYLEVVLVLKMILTFSMDKIFSLTMKCKDDQCYNKDGKDPDSILFCNDDSFYDTIVNEMRLEFEKSNLYSEEKIDNDIIEIIDSAKDGKISNEPELEMIFHEGKMVMMTMIMMVMVVVVMIMMVVVVMMLIMMVVVVLMMIVMVLVVMTVVMAIMMMNLGIYYVYTDIERIF